MRLSEAIRLGSLVIDNPRPYNSTFCAIGMACESVGRRSMRGTGDMNLSDANVRVVCELWPWVIGGDERFDILDTYLRQMAYLFDSKVCRKREMTIEGLCDQVAAWERELAAKGINVEQVTMAATPETTHEPAAEQTEKVSA